MLPKDPWTAFGDELEKLDEAYRKQRPFWSQFSEQCPAIMVYLVLCVLHILLCMVPWVIGAWQIVTWLRPAVPA